MQAGIKIAKRNLNNLRYADDNTVIAESEEEIESLDESERGWVKHKLESRWLGEISKISDMQMTLL